MKTQSCTRCAWAVWERTKSGRIKTSQNGKCEAPTPKLTLPECIEVSFVRYSIWFDSGKDCPVFKDAKTADNQKKD